MVNNKPNKPRQQQQQQQNVAGQKTTTTTTQQQGQKHKTTNNGGNNKKTTINHNNDNMSNNDNDTLPTTRTTTNGTINSKTTTINRNNNNNHKKPQQKYDIPTSTTTTITTATTINTSNSNNNIKPKTTNQEQQTTPQKQQQQQQKQQQPTTKSSYRNSTSSYAQTVGQQANNNKTRIIRTYSNNQATADKAPVTADKTAHDAEIAGNTNDAGAAGDAQTLLSSKPNPGDILSAALAAPCAKCSKTIADTYTPSSYMPLFEPLLYTGKQYRKSKSYVGGASSTSSSRYDNNNGGNYNNNTGRQSYRRSYSDRRSSFDRNFAERNKDFVPIVQPAKPVLSASTIAAVIADHERLTLIERLGKGRISYPVMQCGTLDAPDSSYHQQRSNRMDVYQIDDGFHSDGGTETPPPSPSSGSSIASTSDHGSLESVDTGGTQRLAVLSFEQVRKLHDVMDEKVAIHGRGNFPTLEVKLKDLVNAVRRKLEADVGSGGAGVIVKDIRLNGGAASHVLASENQPYNDLDLIYAIELTSSRHFDRVKTAVLNTLLDLLPEGVSKRRIMPCSLKEAYVGKMVKVNNNNDGDRWSLISLGNSPVHKNVELKFVDTMRRQFEFSIDSFQIVLDSLLLFYDCAALPISENFYPTVVGESVYGDFQEALYHLQKKLISTRQPEEIRGGGLLKYCNLLVRNYKPVDPQHIKTLERYMCSRFFIDFPDINTQTVKLEAYLRNHFWDVDEEPMQYQYLMHLREVVEMSTVCLMGHERRQTLLLIQSLAAQVLYKEQHKHHQAQAQEHYQQQVADMQHQHQQQQQHQHQHQSQHQQQTIYLQQAPPQQATATICCTVQTGAEQQQQQQQSQQQQQQSAAASVPQTIQIQAGPPGLIYANGVYYAPVIPTTICTCNSTWLST